MSASSLGANISPADKLALFLRLPLDGYDELAMMSSVQADALLHCVQRERGATCAWVASGGTQTLFRDLMLEWRRKADEACQGSAPPTDLAQLRASVASLTRDRAPNFYDVFSGFNAICSELVSRGSGSKHRALEEFARLKEATGVERAFVCGVLSMHGNEEVVGLPPRAFADFVMCVHAQHAHTAALRKAVPPALLPIISEAFELSPELSQAQQRLAKTFDLLWMRETFTVESWWELITSHIDKLQGVQATLLAELRRAAPAPHADTDSALTLVRSAIDVLKIKVCDGVDAGEAMRLKAVVEQAQPAALQAALARLLAQKAASLQPERPAVVMAGTAAGEELQPISNRPGAPMGHDGHQLYPTDDGGGDDDDDDDMAMAGVSTRSPLMRLPHHLSQGKRKVVRIDLEHLTFERQIGAGAGGTTYLAHLKGAGAVAVKVASGAVDGWHAETALLSSLDHPHIVRYLGAVVSPPTYCMVLEHCAGSDLRRALTRPTPPGLFLSATRGICEGMAFLHSRGVLHRDLKSANVLLAGAPPHVVKLSDLGLAVGAPTSSSACAALTAEAGTHRWMAPETFRHKNSQRHASREGHSGYGYGCAADVFSFAMVLFELLTHELPFARCSPLEAAAAVAIDGLRPPLPSGTPEPVAALTAQCWTAEPDERPSFAEVLGLVAADDWLSAEQLRWLDAPLGHPVYSEARRPRQEAYPVGA